MRRYGEEILPTLSAKLVPEFGEGFRSRNLARMIAFAEVYPDETSRQDECRRNPLFLKRPLIRDEHPTSVGRSRLRRFQMVRSVSDMAKAQDEQIPLRFAAMSDTPAIEVNR